jgi:aconitate hydratase
MEKFQGKQDFIEELNVEAQKYYIYSVKKAAGILGFDINKLPNCLKVLLENLLRYYDNETITFDDLKAFGEWITNKKSQTEIAFRPTRVLMQDFTGVPAIVDLAAMRDAVKRLGGNPQKVNPIASVDLVIDHSVQVDAYGNKDAFNKNVELEMIRNGERYEFLRWGQEAFDNFKVVPPGTGICHQVNLEYLAKVVWSESKDGKNYAYPDSIVGTDSHTTMINGLAVLGWGVGGIEAEAAMLGQPISMVLPEVVGFKLTGSLQEGVTATDLVLTVTNLLRKQGVVGKLVEFYGEGLNHLSLADRATIANMAPEYGATCGYFPVDNETLKYLDLSNRDKTLIKLVEAYSKAQNLWADQSKVAVYSDSLELDLAKVQPSIAGPKRPQDRINLDSVTKSFKENYATLAGSNSKIESEYSVEKSDYKVSNGDVVIAAITSCTNTSNPSVMLAAGIVAKKAAELGILPKPWVKTSLAPGSKVVTEYLEKSGLQKYLDMLGFNLVGYGCTTCIGNSGPLKPEIEAVITNNDMFVASVLSGNRNFEGRVHPLVKANYLASPPLVVIYSLAGSMKIDITKDPIGKSKDGKEIFLKDLWPSNEEIRSYVQKTITREMFAEKYNDVFKGDLTWQKIKVSKSMNYEWKNSSYINNPPYFDSMTLKLPGVKDIENAALLAKFGDSITTDHISPAGDISKKSPAADYLRSLNVDVKDFNSYGARRGNDKIMVRGTFANIRIKNEIAPGTEGGVTTYFPSKEIMSIYDAAEKYKAANRNLIIVAGKEYGTGSSRDWAAKGPLLLGVKGVIAESFERIHRSNLVGMGIIPLTFTKGATRNELNLKGNERFDIIGIADLKPKKKVKCVITYEDNSQKEIELNVEVYTEKEVEYLNHGGILHYMIRSLI